MLIELFQPQPAFSNALASYETGGPWLTATPVTGWLAAVGLIVLAITAVRFWKIAGLGWSAHVHATLLPLASVAFISFAWYRQLLAPSRRF